MSLFHRRYASNVWVNFFLEHSCILDIYPQPALTHMALLCASTAEHILFPASSLYVCFHAGRFSTSCYYVLCWLSSKVWGRIFLSRMAGSSRKDFLCFELHTRIELVNLTNCILRENLSASLPFNFFLKFINI